MQLTLNSECAALPMMSSLPGLLAAGLAGAPALVADMEAARFGGEHVLGTSFDLAVAGAGRGAAEAAGGAALAEIARLDAILSAWREDSELGRLNASRAISVSPELFAVVARAERWRAASGGAFTARLGRLTSGATADAPQGEAARELRQAAETARVGLDPAMRRIERPDAVRFDLDAIAKGYVLDRALVAAWRAAPGAEGLMLDIGGDLRVWSAPSRVSPWRLAVADPDRLHDNAAPLQTLALRQGALAVSGAGPRDRQIAGRAVPHVLDPRSGAPARARLAAATAPSAIDADALATALLVLPPAEGLGLVDRLPGTSALVVGADGAALASRAWTGQAVAACQAASSWPKDFVVSASVQIPQPAGGAYKRPYVAVWITDEARNHVRTLLVLGAEARWRENNYIFWRRIERMDLAAVARVARPTRAPGRYEVAWDGRTEAGLIAPRGKYALNIEASREHGGHSFVAVPLDLGAQPFERQAEGAQELGPTLVRYGRAR